MKYEVGQTLYQKGTGELSTITSRYYPQGNVGDYSYDVTTSIGNFRLEERLIDYLYSEVSDSDIDSQPISEVNKDNADEPIESPSSIPAIPVADDESAGSGNGSNAGDDSASN